MIKTLKLTANTETSIGGLGGTHCRINNNTAGTLYASANGGIVPGGDDVTAIHAGRGDYVVGTQGTVYLLSSSGGSVQAEGTDVLNRPFDNAAVTGGVAVGNPVVMDGLQGGVPFSEIVVSGENIAGRELTINACGKNLTPYPYYDTTKTVNGITFTDNGDGSITVNGRCDTSDATFYMQPITLLPNTDYVLSGCPVGGSRSGYRIQFATNNWSNFFVDYGSGVKIRVDEKTTFGQFRIIIPKGIVCDNLVFRPQLEIGTVATAYEPYHGAEYAITPDSNPYTVPNDIRQQDGLNTVSVSGGELTVEGIYENHAIKKIWDKIDELTTAVIVSTADLSE